MTIAFPERRHASAATAGSTVRPRHVARLYVPVMAAALIMAPLGAAGAEAKEPLTAVACGQMLTHSVRVANDLTNCPGDGLVIGADAITVDLNGHTIDGDVTKLEECNVPPFGTAGVNTGGRNGLTIKNGVVQQFGNGVATGVFANSAQAGMTDSKLRNLTLRDNRFGGIALAGDTERTDNNRIEHNVIADNGCGAGIELHEAHANHVADNRVSGNATGILVCCTGSDHNAVENNAIVANQFEGINVAFGSDDVIEHNVVSRNGDGGINVCCGEGDQHHVIAYNEVSGNFIGIVLDHADANRVTHNHVTGNGDDIGVLGNHNTISDNRISDAVGCPASDPDCGLPGLGIGVDGGTGNLIAGNAVRRTLGDGIGIAIVADLPAVDNVVRDNRVRDASADGFSVAPVGDPSVIGTVLERNVAIGSGDDGFDIRSAATTLTANLAVRNGDLGIDAVPGVTDGGDNRAYLNGNPAQCIGVACS
ncbi:MAG: hypothetical protein QOG15_948 [Solirubrobacteraceae bacterium]|nr:hypothetical protein [Solirubrobacteraceae bacterium]